MRAIECKLNYWDPDAPNYMGYSTDWANSPELLFVVDELPAGEFIYKSKPFVDSTLHYAELDGLVKFYLEVPGDRKGFGGAGFNLKFEDGSERTIYGPWSSRAGVVNRETELECIDCGIQVEGEPGVLGAHVTLKWAQEAVKKFVGRSKYHKLAFARLTNRGEKYFMPVMVKDGSDEVESGSILIPEGW